MQNSASPVSVTYAAADRLTVHSAFELKEKLADLLRDYQRVELDLSAVTEVDAAGLQLLIMAKRTLHNKGGELHLINHSQAVLDVLTLCGLDTFFGDPVLIQSPAA